MMEEDRVYPPRFEVQVCGSLAREAVTALICFRGMADVGNDTTELVLEPAVAAFGGLRFPSPCSWNCNVILCALNAGVTGTSAAGMEVQPPYHMLQSVSMPIINQASSSSPSYIPVEKVYFNILY